MQLSLGQAGGSARGGMRLCIFSSGSKQNCFYVESEAGGILIDMGISYRCLRAELKSIGRSIADVRGIFISHEHSDHTRGLATLVKYTEIPIYIHQASERYLGFPLPHSVDLQAHETVQVGELSIHPFTVKHDAANTFGFRITNGERALFLASDIGSFNEEVLSMCEGCHAIGIESNYDPTLLRECDYPAFLKARIRGARGHLSNEDAVSFLTRVITSGTRTVLMLHLSANSNSRELVQHQIDQCLAAEFSHVEFHVSHRDKALPPLEI